MAPTTWPVLVVRKSKTELRGQREQEINDNKTAIIVWKHGTTACHRWACTLAVEIVHALGAR
jgi:hypothetical protein